MTVLTQSLPSVLAKIDTLSTESLWRFSVEQYHEMIRTGILTDDDPVELLEGWLITKMPKNARHRLANRKVLKAIEALLLEGYFADAQEPITFVDSEPEPDVTVVLGDPDSYFDHHPSPQDVALVVEVSDATLKREQGWKKRLYASAGIPVYWIVNLPQNRIEIYTEPSGPGAQPDYSNQQNYDPSDEVPVVISGQEIGHLLVSDLLPKPN